MRLLLAATLLIAQPMLAVPAHADDKPGETAKKPKPKMICRREKTTGSRLATATCHSQEEWDAIDKDVQAQADREVSRIQAQSIGTGSGYSSY